MINTLRAFAAPFAAAVAILFANFFVMLGGLTSGGDYTGTGYALAAILAGTLAGGYTAAFVGRAPGLALTAAIYTAWHGLVAVALLLDGNPIGLAIHLAQIVLFIAAGNAGLEAGAAMPRTAKAAQ